MYIKQVLTQRTFQHWPSWDLVYEWEDVLIQCLNLKLANELRINNNKIIRNLPIVNRCLKPQANTFIFEMNPHVRYFRPNNKKNIIPCIIDFYLRNDNDLHKFYREYDKNPVVLISSREVYDYLKGKQCPLNIKHFPLSISDKYSFTHGFDKKYDIVLMGRQNPKLTSFLKKYVETHKDCKYAYRVQKGGQFHYYTSDDEYLGDINTRNEFMALMSQARCGLYSTPGVDGEKQTNGFSQVTPRFLELVACGCHVIARYSNNSDAEYFKLSDFSNSIETYEAFEMAMDYSRAHDIDKDMYAEYLSHHYTSKRAELLREILSGL